MDVKLLGKRIRDERLLSRLTIEQLSERIDKSLHFVGQIERGECNPSVKTLVDIANALGTTVDSLLSDSLKEAGEDGLIREINILLHSVDENGKLFILDMVKRYIYHHGE
ncbi:MAG: helix-turn-helix domain-containing protein [Clostridiales bacterium]|jgi:transcriptional regulator with XRE-family HTH domain|nr:helix-turn-helix domain-containing protein [Clostridiales bacterium]